MTNKWTPANSLNKYLWVKPRLSNVTLDSNNGISALVEKARGLTLSQSDANKRPIFFNNNIFTTIAMNGTAETRFLSSGNTQDYIMPTPTIIPLPDGAGEDPGKGFTCTGLTYDLTENCFWVANDGRIHGHSANDGFHPSIVKMSLTGEKLGEVLLSSNFPSMGTLQGIAYDPTDDSLWVASSTENLVRHIHKDGTSISSFSLNQVNGLAYDPDTDSLYVTSNADYVLKRYSKAGVLQNTFPALHYVDQLFKPVGDKIYYTAGDNITSSILYKNLFACYNLTEQRHEWAIPLNEVDAIEGVCFLNNKLYFTNDGYYHTTKSNANTLIVYDLQTDIQSFFIPKLFSQFTLWGLIKEYVPTGKTRAILAVGNPLNTWGYGFCLYNYSSTKYQLIINTGQSQSTGIEFVTTSILNNNIFTVEIDLINKTYAAYVNGTSIGSGTLAPNSSDYPDIAKYLNLNITKDIGYVTMDSNTTDRYDTGRYSELGIDTTIANRQKIEGYLADVYGKKFQLPTNHPYKSNAPTV